VEERRAKERAEHESDEEASDEESDGEGSDEEESDEEESDEVEKDEMEVEEEKVDEATADEVERTEEHLGDGERRGGERGGEERREEQQVGGEQSEEKRPECELREVRFALSKVGPDFDGADEMLRAHAKSLITVEVTSPSDTALHQIAKLPRLRHLSIVGSSEGNERYNSYYALTFLSRLKTRSLSSLTLGFDAQVPPANLVRALPALSAAGLQSLNLKGLREGCGIIVGWLDASTFDSIVEGCKKVGIDLCIDDTPIRSAGDVWAMSVRQKYGC
jgi:hypothetical protein